MAAQRRSGLSRRVHSPCGLLASRPAGFIPVLVTEPYPYTAVCKLQDTCMSAVPRVLYSNGEMDRAEGQTLMFSY